MHRTGTRALLPALLAGLALSLTLPWPALAWGHIGHRIIGRIAENHLSPEAARAVDELIGPETLAQVGYWADTVRSDPKFQNTGPWHYINIADEATWESTPRNPKGDVITSIRRFEAVLRDPRALRAEKVIALKFLVHFAGDVHQPLHVGREEDRGGNSIEVTWHGEPTNLHRLWDSQLIEAEKLSFSEYAVFLDHPANDEIARWRGTNLLDWVAESKALRSQIYDIGNGQLGFSYSYRNLPIAEQRLLQAGLRLAWLLNDIFAAQPPAENPVDKNVPDNGPGGQ